MDIDTMNKLNDGHTVDISQKLLNAVNTIDYAYTFAEFMTAVGIVSHAVASAMIKGGNVEDIEKDIKKK